MRQKDEIEKKYCRNHYTYAYCFGYIHRRNSFNLVFYSSYFSSIGENMIKKKLICKKCGGNKFSFRWEFKDEKDMFYKFLSHDGYGFLLEDAIIRCENCGAEANYEDEDFLEVVDDK